MVVTQNETFGSPSHLGQRFMVPSFSFDRKTLKNYYKGSFDFGIFMKS